MVNQTIIRTGECFCGSVKYKIDGDVYGARQCHCSRCRKAFSAQANSYARVDADQFSWVTGEDLLVTYPAGGTTGKKFCGQCGSTLCGIVEGRVHGVTLGCLNDDDGIQIKAHIFVGSKAPWEVIPENAPQYDEFPEDPSLFDAR